MGHAAPGSTLIDALAGTVACRSPYPCPTCAKIPCGRPCAHLDHDSDPMVAGGLHDLSQANCFRAG